VVVVLCASTGDQQSLTREVQVEVVSRRTVESGSAREYVDVELQVRYEVDDATFVGTTRMPADRGVPDPLRACVDPEDPTRPAIIEFDATCGEAVAPSIDRAAPA